MDRPGTRSPDCHVANGHVSVVDDDPSIRRALTRLLSAAGFTVKTFTSAEDFLASPRTESPQCLVLDVQLGGMSGLALHERLLRTGCTTPVIFITGHEDHAVREWVLSAKAVRCLRKPFDEQALIDAINLTAAAR